MLPQKLWAVGLNDLGLVTTNPGHGLIYGNRRIESHCPHTPVVIGYFDTPDGPNWPLPAIKTAVTPFEYAEHPQSSITASMRRKAMANEHKPDPGKPDDPGKPGPDILSPPGGPPPPPPPPPPKEVGDD